MESEGTDKKEYGDCLMCGKELRKLTRTEDWDGRKYHVTCWHAGRFTIIYYRLRKEIPRKSAAGIGGGAKSGNP